MRPRLTLLFGTGFVGLNPSRDRLPFTSQGDVKGKGAGQLCWIASILCKKTNAASTEKQALAKSGWYGRLARVFSIKTLPVPTRPISTTDTPL